MGSTDPPLAVHGVYGGSGYYFNQGAHALGLKVLIDFVPNHLSHYSAYYRDAVAHGPRSPYYRWFRSDEQGEVTSYSDSDHLENLNRDHLAELPRAQKGGMGDLLLLSFCAGVPLTSRHERGHRWDICPQEAE